MILEGHAMSLTVAGFVKNGVVVPNAPLPEGTYVEVTVLHGPIEVLPELQAEKDAWQRAGAQALESVAAAGLTPAELRRLPREQRQAILAAAAELAEQDYHSDKELTGFEVFHAPSLRPPERRLQQPT
jgi:hypothetical protein